MAGLTGCTRLRCYQISSRLHYKRHSARSSAFLESRKTNNYQSLVGVQILTTDSEFMGRKSFSSTPGSGIAIASRATTRTNQSSQTQAHSQNRPISRSADSSKPILESTITPDVSVPPIRKTREYTQPDYAYLDTTFSNAEEAYRSKTTRELIRALLVFKSTSYQILVRNNMKVC